MFVPIDLLPPIMPSCAARHRAGSRRAWMGVNCVEDEGAVRVVRVNSDSPADVAGLEPGDRIVRIDGTGSRRSKCCGDAVARRPGRARSRLEIVRKGEAQTLKLQRWTA